MRHISSPETITITEKDGILSFHFNHPESGNEVSGSMMDAMLDALCKASTNAGVRVLKLSAVGPQFCTGRERAGRDAASIHDEVTRLITFKAALRASPLITVAEVQGDAKGFGLGMAILCDFTFVSTTARLAFPEMRKGLPPAAIMAYLGRYTLPKASFPLVLFGDDFSPEEALAAGLISRVCEPATLRGEVDALIDRILKLDPESARQCKSFFQAAEEGSLGQNFRLAGEMLTTTSVRLLRPPE
ncbi:MAG: enoyl-CoA hydratase/isomerase family protein [Burkholderiaceae bacterium]